MTWRRTQWMAQPLAGESGWVRNVRAAAGGAVIRIEAWATEIARDLAQAPPDRRTGGLSTAI